MNTWWLTTILGYENTRLNGIRRWGTTAALWGIGVFAFGPTLHAAPGRDEARAAKVVSDTDVSTHINTIDGEFLLFETSWTEDKGQEFVFVEILAVESSGDARVLKTITFAIDPESGSYVPHGLGTRDAARETWATHLGTLFLERTFARMMLNLHSDLTSFGSARVGEYPLEIAPLSEQGVPTEEPFDAVSVMESPSSNFVAFILWQHGRVLGARYTIDDSQGTRFLGILVLAKVIACIIDCNTCAAGDGGSGAACDACYGTWCDF